MPDQALPPGQSWIEKAIEYACLGIPKLDIKSWRLKVHGEVFNRLELTLDEIQNMPSVELVDDLHCVEGWSVRGLRWAGVPLATILEMARPKPSATHVYFKCSDGYSTVLTIEEVTKRTCLLATMLNGKPLDVKSGFPIGLVAPGLYGWKYAKWVSEIVALDRYEPGYWESRGYHERGDVWMEERRTDEGPSA